MGIEQHLIVPSEAELAGHLEQQSCGYLLQRTLLTAGMSWTMKMLGMAC